MLKVTLAGINEPALKMPLDKEQEKEATKINRTREIEREREERERERHGERLTDLCYAFFPWHNPLPGHSFFRN